MSMVITVLPAGRRDYKTLQGVQAVWNAGENFCNVTEGMGGGYINRWDAMRSYKVPGTAIRFRNAKKHRIAEWYVVEDLWVNQVLKM